ncbi:DUF1080 domain-containing protein, partial [Alistipes sp.]
YAGLAKSDADAGYAVDEIKGLMAKLPEAGFEPLSLEPENRKAVVGNPETRKAMKPKALAKAQLEADAAMAQKWSLTDGILTAQANAPAIQFPKQYENFEMILDWKTPGEAGIAVRAIPQIRLGGVSGTGMLADDKGVADADNRPGNWNTLYVKVVDDRITVFENDVKIVENAVMTNPDMPGEPVGICGCIELIAGAAPVEFRNVYVNELPSTPVFELSAEEAAEGFEVLFDGRSLHKWTGNTTNYVPLNGTIDVTAQYGGSGNLYTKKEYSDFVLRFEFRFIREGVNNGIGIRTPMGVDAAFEGMEIQILDHDAPIYKDIKNYQQHGSVYGVIAAKRVKFPPLGDWNVEEIRAVGDRITVTVNGEVILDGNIREACQGHCVGDPGEKGNHYMIDHRNHPGLFNKSGHLGLLGHGAGIQFRNLRVLDLSASGRK